MMDYELKAALTTMAKAITKLADAATKKIERS